MPNTESAKKRVRQNQKRQAKNAAQKSEAKTILKRVEAAVAAEDKQLAEKEMRHTHSKLDKLAKANIWHKNKVARLKAQVAKKVAGLQ